MPKSAVEAWEWQPVVEPNRATIPVMNDTKWNELRLAMDAMGDDSPHWWSLSTNGYRYGPEGDWVHHFRAGDDYRNIVHIDLHARNPAHRDALRTELRKIKLPGIETERGFRIFGYVEPGQFVDYI